LQSRGHFFALASSLMRQILVDHARRRQRAKRGGGVYHAPLQDNDAVSSPTLLVDALVLDEALKELERLDPQRARIVELRSFGGLTVEETAEALDVSAPTVKRGWRVARAWLYGRVVQTPPRRP
jgi:RNA polymerase sigma factor (TIGR02999 family)